ncbi:odorant receptor 131-2-like isoform X1 [Erpetoichthys calabaricus]|uniref:G-protein coupled receptors family 1 profile domain-containing protein n=1 Tax=Erpetoichthys calabaricus TaxID=27687 RepID=A0A8C4SBF3_ERPCA|nr:odorant receptor 131-2-like isoform X1 [Erpetoichthys calabaricus]
MEVNVSQNNNSQIFVYGKNIQSNFYRVVLAQVLVCVFLYINLVMLFSFFKKEAFRQDTRYILFAHMLFVDTMVLIVTDLGMLLIYFCILVPGVYCILFCTFMETLTSYTPLTLTAMCLERYIAICIPLRHAEISTVQRTLFVILFIWIFGFILCSTDFFAVLATQPESFYLESYICSYEIMLIYVWQSDLRSYICLVVFISVFLFIALTYVKIMHAARAASVEKTSASKARNTVVLHAFQLVLSLISLICPFVEKFIMQINFQIFSDVRYFNFLTFTLFPRCLSPLIYGLRDEKFCSVFQYYIICGMNKPTLQN